MSKEFILVYQDCPMCGSRKWWGEKQISFAKARKATIRKVSFVSSEGQKYCFEALQAGKASMPFFTDGEGHFGKDYQLTITFGRKLVVKPKCFIFFTFLKLLRIKHLTIYKY